MISRFRLAKLFIVLILALPMAFAGRGSATEEKKARAEIDAFNRSFTAATLAMDNAAVMALWAGDGVTLLPGMKAVSGKKTIAAWLDDIVARMPGYKVTLQEDDFHDIVVSGDWASEWGTTHQVVQPPDGKPPIETWGKVLLVLHREKDGQWRIEREMWNQGVKP